MGLNPYSFYGSDIRYSTVYSTLCKLIEMFNTIARNPIPSSPSSLNIKFQSPATIYPDVTLLRCLLIDAKAPPESQSRSRNRGSHSPASSFPTGKSKGQLIGHFPGHDCWVWGHCSHGINEVLVTKTYPETLSWSCKNWMRLKLCSPVLRKRNSMHMQHQWMRGYKWCFTFITK